MKGRFVKKEDQAAMILSMRLSAMQDEKDSEMESKTERSAASPGDTEEDTYMDGDGDGEGDGETDAMGTSGTDDCSSSSFEHKSHQGLETFKMSDGADDEREEDEEDPDCDSPVRAVSMSAPPAQTEIAS